MNKHIENNVYQYITNYHKGREHQVSSIQVKHIFKLDSASQVRDIIARINNKQEYFLLLFYCDKDDVCFTCNNTYEIARIFETTYKHYDYFSKEYQLAAWKRDIFNLFYS